MGEEGHGAGRGELLGRDNASAIMLLCIKKSKKMTL